MRTIAIFGRDFRAAFVSVGGRSSFLNFDEHDAKALELCIESLAGQPPAVRIDFYEDLLDGIPLHGQDGLLRKYVKP